MNPENALGILDEMRNISKNRGLGLLVVGSVGYRSAFLHREVFELCDDLDCIFLYEHMDWIQDLPYLRNGFIPIARNLIGQKKADMFSTKLVRNGIKISADFISLPYLRGIEKDDLNGVSTFRRKLTDAVEKPENTYCNIRGESILYHKPCEEYGDYRIYTLPIHLYAEENYYPGVLLNKLLYNPLALNALSGQDALIKGIQTKIYNYCSGIKDRTDVRDRLMHTAYKRNEFSEETRHFLASMKGDSI